MTWTKFILTQDVAQTFANDHNKHTKEMNWDKLPAHRRIVLMLRDWRHTTLWLDDSQWFRLNASLDPADADVRLDDNNLCEPLPTK